MANGHVGAPVGNQNAVKGKRWTTAVENAFAAWPEKPDSTGCSDLIRGLNEAAHEFVAKLHAEKDIAFFRETGDRLDGKPAQAITNADGGNLVINLVHSDEAL